MVAISFKREWEELLQSGMKTQTIRPLPKPQRLDSYFKALRGEQMLQIWIDQRTSNRKFLFEARCKDIIGVRFAPDDTTPYCIDMFHDGWHRCGLGIFIEDGFNSLQEMIDWFRKEYGDKMYDMGFVAIRFQRVDGGDL